MGVATLPGHPPRRQGAALRALSRPELTAARDLDEVADIYESFRDPRARAAIRHVVRAVVDMKGQIVTMVDRAYLTQAMPMCVVWGNDDAVIPASTRERPDRARRRRRGAAEQRPLPAQGPPGPLREDRPDFVRTTQPASYHRGRWRELLRNGPRARQPCRGRRRRSPGGALQRGAKSDCARRRSVSPRR